MTFQVLKSQADKISKDFDADVEEYRQRLLVHRFAKPAEGYKPAIPAEPEIEEVPAIPARGLFRGREHVPGRPGHPAVPEVPGYAGEPRPTSHPLIESCIVRIQEPGKPDDFISDYEIIYDRPPLRERKDALLNQVSIEENALLNNIWPRGKVRADLLNQAAIMAKDESLRTPAEREFLADLTNKQNKYKSIQGKAALLMSQIEDLTDANIESWTGKLTE